MTNTFNDAGDSSIAELLRDVLSGEEFVKGTLSKPRRTTTAEFRKVAARPIRLQEQSKVQLAYQFPQKETHENLSPVEAANRLWKLLENDFQHGHIYTAECEYSFRLGANGTFRIRSRSCCRDEPIVQSHDRPKRYLIPEGELCPFLVETGVMNRRGQVLAAKQKKFRQINRYLEIVNDVVKHLPQDRPLRVIDFGCGNSYLTFALHHLLTEHHDFEVSLTGIDREADVIQACRGIASRLQLFDVEFHNTDIKHYATEHPVDLAVSLHACDTATDDALARSVEWGAEVILAAPCCQHELMGQLENRRLAPLLGRGILRERAAALITDALRAAALEICGYSTTVLEFIELEHTAKNLLIRAVKSSASLQLQTEHVEAYLNLKQEFSLQRTYLEQALEPLGRLLSAARSGSVSAGFPTKE